MFKRLLNHRDKHVPAAGFAGFDALSDIPAENTTYLEGFEWYSLDDGQHWARLKQALPSLQAIGIDAIWIPPASKAGDPSSNGYDCYDLYDLGEFHQKGSRRTKWGNKEDLDDLISAANKLDIGIIWDTILNHKAWADHAEEVLAVKCDPLDRRKEIAKPEIIKAWLKWDFPGRNGKYSQIQYTTTHFNGTDYNDLTREVAIYKLASPAHHGWAPDVDTENGNADYLLCANHNLSHPAVRQDLFNYGVWLGSQYKLAGMRIDAVKHFSANFAKAFIQHMDRTVGRDWFFVGEYCKDDLPTLCAYIEHMEHRMSLFDFSLHGNFVRLSWEKAPDLRTVLSNTLTSVKPANTVQFVTNHDTQERAGRMQDFETRVAPWFHMHAYALILLRHSLARPCVFFGDLYGTLCPGAELPPSCGGMLPKMVLCRKMYAYGSQIDYFDSANSVGWTRAGDARVKLTGYEAGTVSAGMAVLVNAGKRTESKRMFVGEQRAGEQWTDVLGFRSGRVTIDGNGHGEFSVAGRSVGIWINERAPERAQLDALVFEVDFYGRGAGR